MTCSAKRSDGNPCTAPAIKGGNVCRVHGGSAPQVRERAKLRLLEMVDPALAVLVQSMKAQEKQPQVALAAAKDVLDRAGLKPTDKHEITGADGGPISNHMVIEFVESDGNGKPRESNSDSTA